MRTILLSTVFLVNFYLSAQDMAQGFTLLETGKYTEATSFFNDILTTYPKNKTAKLCYGRALGLSGQTKNARALFTTLKQDYPGDFEVALNYAEALLWDADYTAAKITYKNLVAQDSTSFPAVLGYANTLSNLQEYDTAIQYISKALHIQPGNTNALISKKYIYLGKAAELNRLGHYEQATSLLLNLLNIFPEDQEILQVLASSYTAQKKFELAHTYYQKFTDTVQMQAGRSFVAHLQKNKKQALIYAEIGLAFAKAKLANSQTLEKQNNKDNAQIITAYERYVQALIWNANYKNARTTIAQLTAAYPGNKRVLVLKATLGMYTGTFSKSIQVYQKILEKDSTSFDGNLGIANAYRAQGNLDQAKMYAQKTLHFFPSQKDALALLESIKNSLKPVVETVGAYTQDNGNNNAYSAQVSATIPFASRFKTNVSYNYRETKNTTTQTMAYNTSISLGAHYRLHNNTWIESTLGFIKANAATNNYTDVNGQVLIKSKPLPLQYLEVGYKRTLQDFNAALVDQKIFMNNYILNYNMGTNVNLGWYTGLMHTQQTDGNSRNLLFSSLYYTFTKNPTLKGGINYQYLSFKKQVPTLYFSPSQYQAVEGFIDFSKTTDTWAYGAKAALGFQFTEDEASSNLFRLEGKLDYIFSKHLQTGAYLKYSNIAAATAVGFEFMEVGVKFSGRF